MNAKIVFLLAALVILLSLSCQRISEFMDHIKYSDRVEKALEPVVKEWYVSRKNGIELLDNVPQKYSVLLNPPDSKVISIIPICEKVNVESYDILEVEISNIKGVFCHVTWNNKSGVVFNGFLCAKNPCGK